MLRKRSRSADFAAALPVREHQHGDAEWVVGKGLKTLELMTENLIGLPRGEWRKAFIGLAVKRTTTVPLEWIVNRLQMGTRSTVNSR